MLTKTSKGQESLQLQVFVSIENEYQVTMVLVRYQTLLFQSRKRYSSGLQQKSVFFKRIISLSAICDVTFICSVSRKFNEVALLSKPYAWLFQSKQILHLLSFWISCLPNSCFLSGQGKFRLHSVFAFHFHDKTFINSIELQPASHYSHELPPHASCK